MPLTPTQPPKAPDPDQEEDEDMEMEWEDVPIQHQQHHDPEISSEGLNLSVPSMRIPTNYPETQNQDSTGEPEPVRLPPQRHDPIPPGSKEETHIRTRLSAGIERIQNRSVKTKLRIFLEDAPDSERGYASYAEFAGDVEGLVDLLWGCATPSLQIEGLITLAGMATNYLSDYVFDTYHTLHLLNKFDAIFVALCTGRHPLTNLPLPGSEDALLHPLVTQTQKVRIKSLAEQSRSLVFVNLNLDVGDDDDNENGEDRETRIGDDGGGLDGMKRGDDDGGDDDAKWTTEVSAVYVKIISLLSDEFETELQ